MKREKSKRTCEVSKKLQFYENETMYKLSIQVKKEKKKGISFCLQAVTNFNLRDLTRAGVNICLFLSWLMSIKPAKFAQEALSAMHLKWFPHFLTIDYYYYYLANGQRGM